ncbi:MAG TPA: D-2-hydroxyacid dehydrogenase [Candidatus Sulfotelmatobacter sp.]|nr:D-2-hydroxyacid dehydrogenase [Candidatus Sulfotelmatobacter sp.]
MAVENQTLTVAVFDPDGDLPGLGHPDGSVRFIRTRDAGGFAGAIGDADAVFLVTFRSGILKEVWQKRRRLRWVHVAAVGVDAILFPALVASDVILTNSRGVFDAAMGEYVLALMLAMAKDLPRTIQLQGERRWQHRNPSTLRGAVVLVVGAGGVGTGVAQAAAANRTTVIGVGRQARAASGPFQRIAGVAELKSLVPEADWVVLATPLTGETRGLFSRELIWSMRPSARLINVARGDVLDEQALVEALEAGRIAGAALDVFKTEPLPADHPLWRMPNVIISPHMSVDVPEANQSLIDLFLQNLDRFQRGAPLLNVVDKHLGYVPSE